MIATDAMVERNATRALAPKEMGRHKWNPKIYAPRRLAGTTTGLRASTNAKVKCVNPPASMSRAMKTRNVERKTALIDDK